MASIQAKTYRVRCEVYHDTTCVAESRLNVAIAGFAVVTADVSVLSTPGKICIRHAQIGPIHSAFGDRL